MAKFRTNFWSLLSEKEQLENRRYNNVSEISKLTGISRVTLYRYADDELSSIDASTVRALMQFLNLKDGDIGRFLLIGVNPQSHAQGARAAVAA